MTATKSSSSSSQTYSQSEGHNLDSVTRRGGGGEGIWVQRQWMVWIDLRFGQHPVGWFHNSFSGKKDTSSWNAQGKDWTLVPPSKGTQGRTFCNWTWQSVLFHPPAVECRFSAGLTTLLEPRTTTEARVLLNMQKGPQRSSHAALAIYRQDIWGSKRGNEVNSCLNVSSRI